MNLSTTPVSAVYPKPLVQPRFRLLFGGPNYAKPIYVGVALGSMDKVTFSNPAAHTNIFIRPADKMKKLFPKAPQNAFLQASFAQAPTQVLQVKGNILTGVPQDAASSAIQSAFLRAMLAVPQETKSVTVSLPANQKHPELLAQNLAEQTALMGYNPRIFRQDSTNPVQLEKVLLANLPRTTPVQQSIKEGLAIAGGMNLTRHLVDGHPGIKNPQYISEQAKALESELPNLQVTIHDQDWIKSQKMGLFLSVAAGNQRSEADAPRLLEMEYRGEQTNDSIKPKTILLVGKGITFDTGGMNLKPSEFIHDMHGDMAGAAAVIGAMKAIADMKIPNVHVIGLTPLTPNRIGENATLPHTIAYARNGMAVEIDNTDAEGRLVLADAMDYGQEKYKPDLVVDIATLTGGKLRAIGRENAVGVMGNRPQLTNIVSKVLEDLGRKAPAWEVTPTHKNWVSKGGSDHQNHYKLADLYNSVPMADGEKLGLFGPGVPFNRENPDHIKHHAIQGGAFLSNFAKAPWIHLDMAGAEYSPSPFNERARFATGFGVKDLYTIVKKASEGALEIPA